MEGSRERERGTGGRSEGGMEGERERGRESPNFKEKALTGLVL